MSLKATDPRSPYFISGFVYPEPRPDSELNAVDLVDGHEITSLELELHNESQLYRRAAIIQSHFDRIKASAAPKRRKPVRIPIHPIARALKRSGRRG